MTGLASAGGPDPAPAAKRDLAHISALADLLSCDPLQGFDQDGIDMRKLDRRSFITAVPVFLAGLVGVAKDLQPQLPIKRLGRYHVVVNGWVLKWTDLLPRAMRWR